VTRPTYLKEAHRFLAADPQGPRIKLGLIFLGGIERNKGCANDAVEIAPVTEETHVTRVIAYPASHQRILRPLA